MEVNSLLKKTMAVGTICLLVSLVFIPVSGTPSSSILLRGGNERFILEDYPLPPPLSVNRTLLDAIFQRMSVRGFTDEEVSDEELSTVLWAAYGFQEDGNRTVSGVDGVHAAVIYVLREDAMYRYDAVNHSLVFYLAGDHRAEIAQYMAPIQLGLVWDKNSSSNENYTGAEIGMIGQNIQFMANALGLGTVVTGEIPSPLDKLGLPVNEVGRIVMPLGYPNFSYNFVYRPMWMSLLPRIQESDVLLSTVLEERVESTSFSGSLTRKDLSHVIWASYGYSYLLDKSDSPKNPIKRHRTVPSAHGYYPLRMYVVTERGIYRYIHGLLSYDSWGLPIVSFLWKIRFGDRRDDIAQASQSFVASAPIQIISVIDLEKTNQRDDLSGEIFRWLWYYEAGASAHNVLLQATALNLSANVVPINDAESVCNLLGLNEEFIPMFVVPVGE